MSGIFSFTSIATISARMLCCKPLEWYSSYRIYEPLRIFVHVILFSSPFYCSKCSCSLTSHTLNSTALDVLHHRHVERGEGLVHMPYSTCSISRFCCDQWEVCAVKYGGRCKKKNVSISYSSWSTAESSVVRVPKRRAGISYLKVFINCEYHI